METVTDLEYLVCCHILMNRAVKNSFSSPGTGNDDSALKESGGAPRLPSQINSSKTIARCIEIKIEKINAMQKVKTQKLVLKKSEAA